MKNKVSLLPAKPITHQQCGTCSLRRFRTSSGLISHSNSTMFALLFRCSFSPTAPPTAEMRLTVVFQGCLQLSHRTTKTTRCWLHFSHMKYKQKKKSWKKHTTKNTFFDIFFHSFQSNFELAVVVCLFFAPDSVVDSFFPYWPVRGGCVWVFRVLFLFLDLTAQGWE